MLDTKIIEASSIFIVPIFLANNYALLYIAWNSGFVWAVGEIERWISGYPLYRLLVPYYSTGGAARRFLGNNYAMCA